MTLHNQQMLLKPLIGNTPLCLAFELLSCPTGCHSFTNIFVDAIKKKHYSVISEILIYSCAVARIL